MAVADDEAHTTAQQIFKAFAKRRGKRSIEIESSLAGLSKWYESRPGRVVSQASRCTRLAVKNVMKKIEAVISPDAAEDVLELLDRRAISNFNLYSIMAKDSLGAHIQTYRGHAYAVDLSPELKLEAVVPDDQVTATAYAILDAARGPGRSFKPRVIITPVTEVILELRDPSSNGAGDPEPSA